jgi:hypothetical protein
VATAIDRRRIVAHSPPLSVRFLSTSRLACAKTIVRMLPVVNPRDEPSRIRGSFEGPGIERRPQPGSSTPDYDPSTSARS